jgi:hypothetical protein
VTLRRKLALLAAANLLALAALALAAELAGRLFLLAHPSYDALFLEPDRALG